MADKAKLTWVNVNVDSFDKPLRGKYDAMREAFAATKTAKEAFEKAFDAQYVAAVGEVPAGNKIVHTYLRGMAVALAPEAASKAKSSGISFAKIAAK